MALVMASPTILFLVLAVVRFNPIVLVLMLVVARLIILVLVLGVIRFNPILLVLVLVSLITALVTVTPTLPVLGLTTVKVAVLVAVLVTVLIREPSPVVWLPSC